MKFLVHSNAPWVKTGYGVQTRHLVERLHAAGHEVAVSCTYGNQGELMPWGPHKIPCYPTGYEVNGLDVIHSHALHFFEGDPLGGWIIPLLDMWCLRLNPMLKEFNIAAWTPVDHFPVPKDVLEFFHRNPESVPIAMSRFGESLLVEAGLDPVYIPLTVDTKLYKPSPSITVGERQVTGREIIGQSDPIPDDAFLVGMVAMNKGWSRDRKGFNEALRAFGIFWQKHQNAVLYLHTDWSGIGMEGIDLKELAAHASVPIHAIRFPDLYALRFGFSPEMMAAVFSSFDVLLSPSHGEGFCVPLIEAQACGTPVIVTDFSSQPELCGAGWRVGGQPEWDPAQHASYVCPYVPEIIQALEAAYEADREHMSRKAQVFAAGFDTDKVFYTHWMPFLASLEKPTEVLPLTVEREPMDEVAVIVPTMRPENLKRLVDSFDATTTGDDVELVVVCDRDFALPHYIDNFAITGKEHTTYAEKVNFGVANTREPWVLLVGDDVEFKPGWLEAARKLSDRYDVIGTNDSSNGVKNPDVAAGRHADHFFVRRSYVEEHGACLDGPGVLAPEVYNHWWVDKEIVELAKARGVWSPCLESVVEHHHPGYEGKPRDDIYMHAIEHAEEDEKTFRSRLPLIQMQRTSRARS